MYVTLEQFRDTWNQIKRESLSHSTCRIAVFVSCLDVDALCAGKILDILLQKDLIPHKIVPVVGYENLKASYLSLDLDIKNVLCVGCGSNVDLEEFLGLDDESTANHPRPKLHIIDNHRPWNLNNLFGNDSIVCYDDGYFDQLDEYRTSYDYLASNFDSDGDDADADADADSIDSNDELSYHNSSNHESKSSSDTVRKRQLVDSDTEDEIESAPTKATIEPTQQDNDPLSNDGSEVLPVAKEPSFQRRKRRRTLRLQHEKVLEEYYAHGSHVLSTDSVQVYTLLTMIGETSLRTLWLTIVGTTALEPQHPEVYTALQPALRDEIRRLSRDRDRTAKTSGTSSRDISFSTENDFSLFLLRQWSLYESMIHSSYLSAKLYLWKEDGRKTLHKMLARIGITLQDARESWIHMNPTLKRELKKKLDSVSGLYGIEGICRTGVIRRFGLDGTLSAGDCAEAIAALLETGDPQSALTSKPRDSLDETDETTAAEENESNEQAQEFWVQNFWTAWDSLEKFSKLRVGAGQAKILQGAVVATGTAIFEKSIPKDLHTYRMVVCQDGPDLATFRNPLSLARLGVWIAEGCAEIHARKIPLVLATPDEQRGVYLVLGLGPHKARDEDIGSISTVYNQFGRIFQLTATKINARVRIDAFESAIIEVAKDDLPRFLQALDTELRSEQRAQPTASASIDAEA